MKRKNAVKLCVIAFGIIAIVIGSVYAQNNKIGDFNIQKVQEAVQKDMVDSVPGFPSTATQNIKPLSENYFLLTLRIIGYLLIMLLVIIVVMWFIRRVGLSGTSKLGGGSMDLLEALTLGQNRSLILVRVVDVVYVLAQTQQSITVLDKIEGAHAVEIIASSKGGTSIVQFKEVFNSFINKIKKTS